VPFFEPLLEERLPFAVDAGGSAFVDRSGVLFEIILQYLRSKERPAEDILKMHGRMALLEECDFYGIECLAQKLMGRTCGLDLRLCDRNIRESEAIARGSPFYHEKNMLLDVHTVECLPLEREALELPLLLGSAPRHHMAAHSFSEFHQRLNKLSGELLQELADIPGIIIAGGSVLAALTGCSFGDVDIFLKMPAANAEASLAQIFEAIKRNQMRMKDPKKRIMVTRSKHAVSFYRVAGQKLANPPVQVITTVIDSILAMLLDFDCDRREFSFCCFA
jgi:hypothetical protein